MTQSHIAYNYGLLLLLNINLLPLGLDYVLQKVPVE